LPERPLPMKLAATLACLIAALLGATAWAQVTTIDVNAPPDRRFDLRLQRWFALTQQYPRQLHEMDRSTYLAQKHKERRQQQALQAKVPAQSHARSSH